MVHQHFRLVEPFTVAENVVLGDHRGEGRAFRLRHRSIERRVGELSKRYGLHVDPRARIWQLSLGEQQRVEILKALYREARILILDEPTAVLTPQEADVLFETLREMAAEGRTVIFISHKLHEVKAVADRVTVLRGGRTIATVSTADATPRSLASLMVGRELRRRGSVPPQAGRVQTPGRGGARARRRVGAGRPRRRGRARRLARRVRRRDRRDRRRCRQRPARARRDDRRHPSSDRGRGARRRPEAARRPARGPGGGRCVRAGGPARHRRRAEHEHRLEPRAALLP